MNITLRMAWRNLWRNKRRTWLTVGAMIFSNLLLVFLISLQFGSYRMMIDNTLRSYTGHMQVQHKAYNDDAKLRNSIAGIIPLANEIRKQLGTDRVAARGVAFAMTSSEQRSYGLQIIGVEPEFETKVSTLPGLINRGHYFTGINAKEIIIGTVLARNLRVDIGDELTLLGSGRDGSFAADVVIVTGIFTSGVADIDRSMAQVPLGYFQSLFNMAGAGHNIVINAKDLTQVADLEQKVSHLIAMRKDLVVLDWDVLQPGLKQAIQADMTSAWFMYAVLIVLVAFSVLNTQLMSVLERTREFGTMMALGVRPVRLGSLVITETFVMSSLGLVIGAALGAALAYYLSFAGFSYPGMDEMADKFNLPDRMYPRLSLLSIFLGPGIVFVCSLLASIYPALRLFFLKPVSAMKVV
ncbi:MAG: FtsX-like permease family protein [Gammaproteobacteria bacterium]|nr:FtsX-like permease family protein [Gammaproteobacteria bacterium]